MQKHSVFSKLLKEPLFHFLLIGAGLFFLFSQLNSEEEVSATQQIIISPSKIEMLSTTFLEDKGRAPTDKEIQKLVEDDIQEEVLFREAVAIGLDKDDMIIRHRLAQKMKYLFEDASSFDEEGGENEVFYESLKSRYDIIIEDEVRKAFNVSVPK